MKMFKVTVATNNQNKLIELKKIAEKYSNLELMTLKDAGIISDPEENGKTLKENAIIKAKAAYEQYLQNKIEDEDSSVFVLAEDFGIFVKALPDVGGVKSNRWLDGTDKDRCVKIIELL